MGEGSGAEVVGAAEAALPVPRAAAGGRGRPDCAVATMATNVAEYDALLELLRKRELPSELQIKELCERATEILGEEDNVQVVPAPVTICGDLHGASPRLKPARRSRSDPCGTLTLSPLTIATPRRSVL